MISSRWLPKPGSYDDTLTKSWMLGYREGKTGKPPNCPLRTLEFKREWLDGYELANDERILAAQRRPYR